jgi:subtilisin-like proprotein convertase family protein
VSEKSKTLCSILASTLFALVLIVVGLLLPKNTQLFSARTPEPHAESPKIQSAQFHEPSHIRLAATPSAHILTCNGVNLEIALDEALVHQPDGSERLIPLYPAATMFSLHERLASVNGEPVAYVRGKERSDSTRRVITRDLCINIGNTSLAPLLKNHKLTLNERPDYAPGWVILSAADPLAALAVVDALRAAEGVTAADVLVGRMRFKRALPNDSLISQQWHLSNNNTTRTHANVESIWNYPSLSGIRGAGIRIGIVDDGIALDHPDFVGNLDTTNDRDFIDSDDVPSPLVDQSDFHGTACAGVAGARGNNSLGVSGVAPSATLVGLRLVSKVMITDQKEASAMSWKNDIIEVKSNSWGPKDDGTVLISDRPGFLTLAALATATTTGRGGRGTIFVWAGGNGGDTTKRDNSNYDGYANSIHTIAVAASNSVGTHSDYSELGANLVVCAPSSGTTAHLLVTTTDLVSSAGYNTASGPNGNYAADFGGTSSATPVVSGIVALMLEKNPNLGWRDVQEILIRSAFKISPIDSGWSNNAAGFHFNHRFGAGLVDATAAVNLADGWTNLTSQTLLTSTQAGVSASIPDNNSNGITRTFTIGENVRVEHATVRITANHTNHRHLDITLTSPSGMVSQLGVFSPGKTGESLDNWTFSSVRHWGENSVGTWTLKVADRVSGTTGSLTAAELQLFGTPPAPLNAPPLITDAVLSETTNGYADTPLTVSHISVSDAEGDPVTYSYLWQSSSDAIEYTDEAEVSSSLAPSSARAGKLWRCVITANDGQMNSEPFTTAEVNLLTRPPASVVPGASFTYTSGLVLAGNNVAISRPAIINEFSQGPSPGTAEWIEILTLQSGSLRLWSIESNGRLIGFKNTAEWDNIPAGTLIVINNGQVAGDPRLPANDIDPADGQLVLTSTNPTYFDNTISSWLDLSDSGSFIKLNDQNGNPIHGLSYGTNAAVSPHLNAVTAGQSAFFNSDKDANANLVSAWSMVAQSSSTPGIGNNPANTAFMTALRDYPLNSPALYRLAAGVSIPSGLTLNSNTGILAGTVSVNAVAGDYPITIERFNNAFAVVSQSFTLTIASDPTFFAWIGSFSPIADMTAAGDPDADGVPNLVEYAMGQNPKLAESSRGIVFQHAVASISLTYQVSKLHNDVTLIPEWSTALDGSQPWLTHSISDALLVDHADHQLRRASLPIDPHQPQRYLRLRAVLTD